MRLEIGEVLGPCRIGQDPAVDRAGGVSSPVRRGSRANRSPRPQGHLRDPPRRSAAAVPPLAINSTPPCDQSTGQIDPDQSCSDTESRARWTAAPPRPLMPLPDDATPLDAEAVAGECTDDAGYKRCSSVWIRECRVSGVSSSSTSTARWATDRAVVHLLIDEVHGHAGDLDPVCQCLLDGVASRERREQ